MVLATLKSLVSTYWPHLLVLLVTAAVIAWKLRQGEYFANIF